MYTIQANPSGTRNLEISEENLATIEKYGLFRHLIDSNGIVDETVLDKLKLNIRSLIASRMAASRSLRRGRFGNSSSSGFVNSSQVGNVRT